MKTLMRFLAMLAVAAMLAACGGGGGCAGTVDGVDTCATTASTVPATSTGAAAVASFVFTLDKASINTSGTDEALLTVTALDASRNVVVGVPILMSVSSGGYQPLVAITDSTGQIKGKINISGDKSNRTIVATFSNGSGVTGTASVVVAGTTVTVMPTPASATPGQTVTVTARATDSTGVPIANASIQLGGTFGFTQLVTTDSSGNATASLAAPAVDGSYTATASGLGATATQAIVVAAVPTIPAAVGPISSASLQINPTQIAPNSSGGTTNRAALTARFLNASNQAIENVRVRFEIVPPGLGSGEFISTGTTTVYSNGSGDATADYVAGTRSSPTNGVRIRICYGLTDAEIAGGACPTPVEATMTVAGLPLSISLGDNNELQKTNNNLYYAKRFGVSVVDAAGNAVAGAVVSASVDITHYGKGLVFSDFYYIDGGATLLTTPPTIALTYLSGRISNVLDPAAGQRIWCENEDSNRNGFVDAGEDLNGTSAIEPRKADVMIQFVSGNKTAADGTLQLLVQYPQNVATWLAYTVKVTTSVGGTEGTVEKSYVTSFVKGDEINGSFLTPPYGVMNCSSAY